VSAHASIIQLPTHATIRAMRARKRRLRVAIIAMLLAAIVAFTIGRVSVHAPMLPHCAEDNVIIGTGDYARGTWNAYACADGGR
jgi:hypothetical protein